MLATWRWQLQLTLPCSPGRSCIKPIRVTLPYRPAASPAAPGPACSGLLAPAGTPRDVVRRVADEVARIVRLDDVRTRLEAMGTVPVGGTPEEFDAFIASETAKWGKVIREAKVVAD